MENNKIVVIGSCNTDMVIKVDHLPKPGETILGYDFMTNQGGKGANQAVAVARLGGNISFVACLGNDSFGKQSLQLLKEESIDTTFVRLTDNAPTGVALIPVDEKGENSIIVSSGANALLSKSDVEKAQSLIESAEVLLMQLETPVDTLIEAARIAHAAGVKVVLNPAPYPKNPLPKEFLELVDIVTPNETETSMMAGVEVTDEVSMLKAIYEIQEMGIQQVIMTAGSRGAFTVVDGKLTNIPAFKTQTIDTTAAGDTFCGALCVAISEGRPIEEAIRFANKAASISVTRMGAWRSIPKREELGTI